MNIADQINAWNCKVESNPFKQGLSIGDAHALAKAKTAPSRELQRKYQKTEHFQRLKDTVIAIHGKCQLCPSKKSLTFHHVHYRTLFEEDVIRDGVLVCSRCHRKLHGKG